MPLIGMFTNLKATDPEKVMRRNAFLIGLQAEVASSPNLKKIRFLSRHADRGALEGPDPMSPDQEYKDKAAQLANKHADVYVASCWPTMNALITATGTNDKIVIAGMFDPKPPTGYYGPKVYGFLSFDLSIADAWIKRLKSFTKAGGAAINKVGVVYDIRVDNKRTKALFDAINAAATANGLGAAVPIDVRRYDLEDKIGNFATTYSAGGLIVPAGTFTAIHRGDVVQYINNNGIPAVYANRLYINSGGLASYGADLLDLYEKAGRYAGKILKGDTIAMKVVPNSSSELVVNAVLAKKQLNTGASNQLLADADVIYDES